MKSCDVFPAAPESDGRGLYDHAWEAVRDGAVVYVTSTALPAFIRRAAPRIPGRYTLVTGDSDAWVPAFLVQDGLPGPGGGMEPGEVQAFIDSPALLHWYGARRPARVGPGLARVHKCGRLLRPPARLRGTACVRAVAILASRVADSRAATRVLASRIQ